MSLSWMLKFLKSQFTTLPSVNVPDLTGRTVIVTGSNVGLGYEAAKSLAAHNPQRLILAVRNTKAGETAAQEIVRSNGGKVVPEVWFLDLGDMKTVKAFADRAGRELDRLDVVISNAGVNGPEFKRTVDGYDTTFQVNNISNSLLSVLLLPLLVRTSRLPPLPTTGTFKPHLAIVSSEMHALAPKGVPGAKGGKEEVLSHFTEEKLFVSTPRYMETKAVNVLDGFTLAKIAGDDVIVNTINPGFCHSELARDLNGVQALFIRLFKLLIARTTEVGARNLVWAATQETPSGAYVEDCKVSRPSDYVLSQEGQKAGAVIWETMKSIWAEKVGVDADKVLATL